MSLLLSFTGADDNTSTTELFAATRYIEVLGFGVEWGILFHPEKMGFPRTPGYEKRKAIAATVPAAAHLCGKYLFDTLCRPGSSREWYGRRLLEELKNYERIQVNINARKREYSSDQVEKVYEKLLGQLPHTPIIMQWHEDTSFDIENAVVGYQRHDSHIGSFSGAHKQRIHYLIDGSRGKGIVPEKWTTVSDKITSAYSHYLTGKDKPKVGMAGGLTIENIVQQLERFKADTGTDPDWVDAESAFRYKPFGSRDGDRFSVAGCVNFANTIKQGAVSPVNKSNWLNTFDPDR